MLASGSIGKEPLLGLFLFLGLDALRRREDPAF